MKMRDRSGEGREHGSGIVNISNVLAALVLVFFLFLMLGLRYIGALESDDDQAQTTTSTTTQTTTGTATEKTTTPQPTGSLNQEELFERERAFMAKIDQIRQIVVIRDNIINDLKDGFAGSGLEMIIDDATGDIRLREALLFAVGVDALNAQGQQYIEDFVPIYLSIVLDDEYREYIDQIIIEGHSDDEGTYLNNLALSQRRSVSVATHIFTNGLNVLPDGTLADEYFAISGRSFSLMVEDQGGVDRALSRRVEFKFRLKDHEMIEQMRDISKWDY